MNQNRKLVAIMFTDIVGYTAMMGESEMLAVQTVGYHESTVKRIAPNYQGELINFYGDGSLSIYPSVTFAIECGWELQKIFQNELKVPLRIGIHIGEVFFQDGNIFGDGVNIASRIESLGQSGSVLFSEDVYQKIRNNSRFETTPVGQFEFKNVERPMQIYALANPGCSVPDKENITGKLKQHSLSDEIQKSIAVLPFENNSQDKSQDFLIDGIADEIRAQLLSINELKVISRSSCMYFKNRTYHLNEIAEQLNVQYALEGRVQILGNHIKVSAELSNIKLGLQVWSLSPKIQKFEDVFLFQTEMAAQVAHELKIALTYTEKSQLRKVVTNNSDAYLEYQSGKALLNNSVGEMEDLDKALICFEKAIEIDPEFSKAYIGISNTYLEYIFWGRKPSKAVLEKALKTAQKALDLDITSGEAYGVLGAINFFKFNEQAAQSFLTKAIALSPNYPEAYEKLTWMALYNQELEQAFDYLNTAHGLDPLSSKYAGDFGHIYYYAHQFDKGIQFLEKYPDDPWLIWIKAFLYSGKGDYKKSIETHLSRQLKKPNTNWMLAYDYGRSGNLEKATELLDIHLQKRKSGHVPAYMIATIYMGLGNKNEALNWLEKDYEEGGQGLFFWLLKSDPKFESLQSNDRFMALLKKIS